MIKYVNRKGSALSMVLIIAAILLLSEAVLMYQTRNCIVVCERETGNLQAWFAAKAAIQHSLLKCKLMPTQLYDAAALSEGKNPYFDFTEYSVKPPEMFESRRVGNVYLKLASNLNPGPRFLAQFSGTLPADELKMWTSIAGFHPNDLVHTSNISDWPKDSSFNDVPNPSVYLWKYYSDIKFNSDQFTAASYPYKLDYAISDLEVVSIQEQRKYNEEALNIVARGSVITSRGSYDKNFSTVIRVKRNE